MNNERNESPLTEAELAEIREVGEQVADVMQIFGQMADKMGEEDARLWMQFSMMEANGFVDEELVDALAEVWLASSKLSSLMAQRIFEDKCDCGTEGGE